MRSKRYVLPLLCFLFVGCLLIGSGFAVFYFGDSHATNDGQQVTVKPDERVELGTVTLLDADDYAYQILLDTGMVYLFRTDNPTAEAMFQVRCDFSGTDVAIPAGYRVALACDITITDTDERGVKLAELPGGSATDLFAYSQSAVDLFASTGVSYAAREQGNVTVLEGDASSKSVTYRCVVLEDVPRNTAATASPFISELFSIKLGYLNYDSNNHRGSMAPVNQYKTMAAYQAVMEKTRAALQNATIEVVFRLILQEEGT